MKPAKTGPLWKGPCAEGPLGGVTFSMLSRWLSCRERARVQFIEGIKPAERFNHRTDYGTMWHLCEERFAAGLPWEPGLVKHCQDLMVKFPMNREDITHWFSVCRTQFPVYIEHWSQHRDVKKRVALEQEGVFDIPYKLPSGRIVRLRGKRDGVDLIGNDGWLFETKTKGGVDVQAIQRQLTFDLQTMGLYLVGLEHDEAFWQRMRERFPGKSLRPFKIMGVRYNVVRRPLSGGKGTIQRSEGTKGSKCSKCGATGVFTDKKTGISDVCPKCNGKCRIGGTPAESWDDYYKRLEQVIRNDPGHFFARWNTEITPGDIERFKRECLDPMLENLIDWYGQVTRTGHGGAIPRNYRTPLNWRHPFGAVNTIDEYGASDIDEYLNNGSMAGLRKVTTLFDELKEG